MEKKEIAQQKLRGRFGWLSFVDVLMTLVSGVTLLLATLAEQGAVEVKDKVFTYLGILFGFGVLVFLMTLVVSLLRERSAEATAIKEHLVSTFSDAVDATFLNPKRDIE